MGCVGNYVFRRIGHHVGSLTWAVPYCPRAGGSIRLPSRCRENRCTRALARWRHARRSHPEFCRHSRAPEIGGGWSSRYRYVGTCVMWQPMRPPAVALHETRRRLWFCPPEKAVGATRRVDIRQDVVVHQHAALRHSTRHRAVIDVDGNGRFFAIPAHWRHRFPWRMPSPPSRFEIAA
jgi:hypothetical protein